MLNVFIAFNLNFLIMVWCLKLIIAEMIATNAARTLHHRTTKRKSFVNEVTNIGPGVSVDDYKISAVDFETTTTDTESWDVICSSAVRMSTKKELV